MKARVKATGQIVRVLQTSNGDYEEFVTHDLYCPDELVFDVTDKDAIYNKGWQDGGSDPDYWTRLKHQYAGMAMQTMLATLYNPKYHKELMACYTEVDAEEVARLSKYYAHILVEKMKEE